MQFPFRDLTNQYISLSYQDVVQRYTQGTASYFLDGTGNVIAFVPASSLGQQLVTADQLIFANSSASWASASVSASYAQNAATASLVIYTQQVTSASYASHSFTAETASLALIGRIAYYAYVSEVAETASMASTASLAPHSYTSDLAYHALTADTAESASYADHARVADFALGTQVISGSDANEEFALLFCSQSGGQVPVLKDGDNDINYNPFLGRLSAEHIKTTTITASYISGSIVHAVESDTASLAFYADYAGSASYALESTFSDTASLANYADYAGSASYAFSASIAEWAISASWAPMPQISDSASWASSSVSASRSETSKVSDTASYVGGYNIDGAVAYATDAGFASTAGTASFAWYSESGSYASSASWAPMPTVSNSSSWASSSISASYSVTASSLTGFNFINTGSWISILNTDTPIVQIESGSYDAAFFDYVALSGSNTRAGMVFGSWVNGQINYTEVSNVDIGDTSKVTMSLALAGNVVQLVANVTDTTPWKIKALARYL